LFAAALPAPSGAQGRRPPIVREAEFSGKSYLSLEDVAQAMNGQMHWYPVSNRVDLSFRSHEVQFVVGSDKALVDNQSTALEIPPVKRGRDAWVPKSFFASGPLMGDFRKRIELGP